MQIEKIPVTSQLYTLFSLKTKKFLGFTLVELIVVIGVLAILSTIAMSTINGVQRSSRDATRMSNVSVLAEAFNMQVSLGKPLDTSLTATSYNIALEGSGVTLYGYYGPMNINLLRTLKVTSQDIASGDSFQKYEYAYYPSNRSFQVKATLEKGSVATFDNFVPATYASDGTGTAFVRGNYVSTGGIVGLLPKVDVWNATSLSGTLKYIDGSGGVVVTGDSSSTSADVQLPSGNVSGFAWSEQAGWIDFSTVSVSANTFSGSAFGENIGWIDFNSQSGATLALSTNGAKRMFTGWTWGENAGWINFNTDVTNQAYIDSTGAFKGKIWSENFGWISFDDGTVKVWP